MTIHTSDLIKSLCSDGMHDVIPDGGDTPIQYLLTEGEAGWLNWIGGRYAFSDYIRRNLDGDVVTLDATDVAEALHADGVDRPPCLAESTALCRLVWFMGALY